VSAQQSLDVRLYQTVAEAPTFRPPEFLGAEIDHVNVVKKGTTEGRSTYDIVFKADEGGQKFVVLLTGRLIKTLAAFVQDED
jgi:hypothetical protein